MSTYNLQKAMPHVTEHEHIQLIYAAGVRHSYMLSFFKNNQLKYLVNHH